MIGFTRLAEGSSFRPSFQSDFNNAQQFLAGRTGGRLNGQSEVDRLHVVRERVRIRVPWQVPNAHAILEWKLFVRE